MPPAVNSALALVALGLAVAAIALATIANRRWARRPSNESLGAVLGAESATLRAEFEALRIHVEDLATRGEDSGIRPPCATSRWSATTPSPTLAAGCPRALALLDDTGSGLVLTMLPARPTCAPTAADDLGRGRPRVATDRRGATGDRRSSGESTVTVVAFQGELGAKSHIAIN